MKGDEQTTFPIGETCKEFGNEVNDKMPGIRARHRTIIGGYQPYKWDKAERPRHPPLLLRTLVNRDKHRELQLAKPQHITTGTKFSANVSRAHDFAISRVEPGRVFGKPPKMVASFEPGAEVARVFGKKTGPNPDVDMGFQATVTPTFEGGEWLTDTLEGMGQAITKLFREIEPTLQPLSLLFVQGHQLSFSRHTAVEGISALTF